MSTCRFLERQRGHYAVRELCQVLGVAPSACYAWRQRRQRPAWEWAVCQAFARHARRYGTRRLRAELQAAGYPIGRYRIRRVLRQHELRAQQPRSFVPRTTDSGLGQGVAPNRLLGQPRPMQPDRVWVGDINCLPKQGGGWLYLASWQDACSRKVVGWDLREAMPEDLVSAALRRALAVRQPGSGLIVHSDRGSKYTATRFRDLLADHGKVI